MASMMQHFVVRTARGTSAKFKANEEITRAFVDKLVADFNAHGQLKDVTVGDLLFGVVVPLFGSFELAYRVILLAERLEFGAVINTRKVEDEDDDDNEGGEEDDKEGGENEDDEEDAEENEDDEEDEGGGDENEEGGEENEDDEGDEYDEEDGDGDSGISGGCFSNPDDEFWYMVPADPSWSSDVNDEARGRAVPITTENYGSWASHKLLRPSSEAEFVYTVKHEAFGCMYIGSTSKSPKTRWLEHCLDAEYGAINAIHRFIRRNPLECYTKYRECVWNEKRYEVEGKLIVSKRTYMPHGLNYRLEGGQTLPEDEMALLVKARKEFKMQDDPPYPTEEAIRVVGRCHDCRVFGTETVLRPTCIGMLEFWSDLDPRHAANVGDWVLLCRKCIRARPLPNALWSKFKTPLYKHAWFVSQRAEESVAIQKKLKSVLHV